jgi:hypothetical protein
MDGRFYLIGIRDPGVHILLLRAVASLQKGWQTDERQGHEDA